mmetsp:Transcript_58777/g.164941  ORF Transcript_58777/g.164941 Transcript_58777/m.164941 type:complete len:241 (+) Transcript_58777:371-1093(+)
MRSKPSAPLMRWMTSPGLSISVFATRPSGATLTTSKNPPTMYLTSSPRYSSKLSRSMASRNRTGCFVDASALAAAETGTKMASTTSLMESTVSDRSEASPLFFGDLAAEERPPPDRSRLGRGEGMAVDVSLIHPGDFRAAVAVREVSPAPPLRSDGSASRIREAESGPPSSVLVVELKPRFEEPAVKGIWPSTSSRREEADNADIADVNGCCREPCTPKHSKCSSVPTSPANLVSSSHTS